MKAKTPVISVKHKIFEVEDGEIVTRILSPSQDLVSALYPQGAIKEIKNIKTSSTIDWLVIHTNAGNKFSLKDIKNSNEPIEELLKSCNAEVIKTEANVTHLLNVFYKTQPIPLSQQKTSETNKGSTQEHSIRIPMSSSFSEENVALRRHINYYLSRFGLKEFDLTTTSGRDILKCAQIGDAMISNDLLCKYEFLKNSYSYITSNLYQQMTLIELGNFEFISLDSHLSGTFFEVIYYCAKVQGNEDLVNTLTNSLIKNLDNTFITKAKELKFL